MKIVHIITGLNVGGAEVMLRSLLQHMDRAEFSSRVISLTDIGSVGRDIEALGVPVRAMRMRRGVPEPNGILRLARALRRERPDVVQTWLYHGDLIGGLASRIAGVRAVAWGLHVSHLDGPGSKRSTLMTAKMGARLSRSVPQKIVCCAHSTRDLHARVGYDISKMLVIPNGFDLQKFRPDASARLALREEIGVDARTPIVGLVGRFDPQKDHGNFIASAPLLHLKRPDVRFVLCGEGSEWSNPTLARWIGQAGMRPWFSLLGRRDTSRLLPALDVLALASSYGEAFPMVLGEAMSCGVPCVTTDVGDSARLIGDCGRVVPPRDALSLAAACFEMLSLEPLARWTLGQAARERIAENYAIGSVAARYADLYREMACVAGAQVLGGRPR